MRGIETNTEFLERIMTVNPIAYGGLMQAFVIEAIRSYAETIKEADLSDWGANPFINPDAWKQCAINYINELEKRNEH